MAGEASRTGQDRGLQAVVQLMAKLDVSGLPRNYELFHEALLGGDPALSREVLALPAGPSQTVLDEMGQRHQLPAFVALLPVRGRDQEIKLLLELRDKMASGVTQKKGFSRVLETVARSLRQDSTAGPEDILAEIEYLSVSLSDAVVAETELEAILRAGADRLVKAEHEASVARSVTLRDRLTSLPNHAALAERLEALYGVDADSRDTALFLVTITDLTHLARTYGDPAVNRIVKKAASIFRKAIKKNDFLARIGKGDFAFVFRDVSRDSVQPIAERLIASITDNLVFAASDGTSGIGLSVGAALAADAFSPQELRLQAGSALEAAKANPRLTVALHGGGQKRAS
jgi:diguanylate cyclase (GGDEF)-like protein